jgi:hypothetical protein
MGRSDSSQEDRANGLRGRGLGLAVAGVFAYLVNAGHHRGHAWLWVLVASLLVVITTGWIGGWAGVATGRLPAGRGVRYGVISACLGLAMFIPVAAASDVADGRKTISELPISVLAGMFFGLIPALVAGVLAGVLLSFMVTPSRASPPSPPSPPARP